MDESTFDSQLSRIVLEGFKSIGRCDLKLERVNILIGSNGAGKSNFINFFRMVQQILEGKLQQFVSHQGGPDAILHFGRKKTEQLKVELYFGHDGYFATFEPTLDNRMMFSEESFSWIKRGVSSLGKGHFESKVQQSARSGIDEVVLPAMRQWRVYHFHDTSESALVKQLHNINDNQYLRPDARNLAAFLYLLRENYTDFYRRIVKTVQLVAPFFGDFLLRPSRGNKEKIELEWVEKEQDEPFKAHQLSDGTLRFICLTTVLLQPPWMRPSTILIDEPELGLHPYAITTLASLIKSTSQINQLIISTQSVELLNEFEQWDVIVVDRKEEKSTFRRLDDADLADWLEDYSLGEAWKKNLFGGRPSR
jgi:predicted ATPase